MEATFDVLVPLMRPWSLGLSYCPSVVTIQRYWQLYSCNHSKFCYELSHPYDFLGSYRCCDIFCFSCRVRCNILFTTLPTDCSTIQSKDKSRSGFSIVWIELKIQAVTPMFLHTPGTCP
ncbi:hypothetical protein L3X38_025846 [Prunus dulcis]|uniref:Uncharacterized protein n=1 Tax=Prunus dulcis TaxID=3755 RepID=A0AAD4W4B7_PRUDU|nr:hypothetical protein L3X38_025846 [Prunus dulcis]